MAKEAWQVIAVEREKQLSHCHESSLVESRSARSSPLTTCHPFIFPPQSAVDLPHSITQRINKHEPQRTDRRAGNQERQQADAERNITALLEIITATLKRGDKLALVGFETFEVRQRAARTGRNPVTGAVLKLKAS